MSLTDDALAKLKELQAFIEEQSWTETPQSLLSVIIQGEVLPFLSVIPAPTQPDPFLRDLNSLRLNVAFVSRDLDDKNGASPYQLKAFLYSASSREIVLEVALTDDDFLSDMSPVLNTISASQDTTHCPGFDAEEAEELFSKIRKVDLPSLLIEKYDGKILYRSRTCKYVVFDVDEEETSVDKVRFGSGRHCSDCDRLFKEVDLKYNGGKFSGSADAVQVPKQEEKEPEDAPDDLPQETGEDTGAEEVPDEDEEGERGPPKKRKRRSRGINKSLFGSEFVDPDAALKATVKSEPELTPKKENDENTPDNTAPTKAELDTADAEDLMAGEDDPDDEDYVRPRRTSRLRKMSSKLTQDEHRGSPRKRGRPPIVTKPTKCQECGKVFVILKEYRDHCVSRTDDTLITVPFHILLPFFMLQLEHTNNFPCTFEGCSRRFKVELDLDIHLRKHRGEKPYMCKICDQTFGARQELKVHNKQHVGKFLRLFSNNSRTPIALSFIVLKLNISVH